MSDTPITAVPTKLSEIPGGVYQVASDYQVKFPTEGGLILVAGFSYDKPGAKFQHPSILRTDKKVHGYKHYRKGGTKFWTQHAGVDHIIAVPLDKITALPFKSYSYPNVEINGVRIRLNVSGGSGSGGWTDFVGNTAGTCTNMSRKTLKAICDVGLPVNSLAAPLPLSNATPEELQKEEQSWLEIVATLEVKKRMIKDLDAGKQMKIVLGHGYTFSWGNGGGEEGVATRVMRSSDGFTWPAGMKHRASPPRGFIANDTRVKFSQVDWMKTAAANGLDAMGNDVKGSSVEVVKAEVVA